MRALVALAVVTIVGVGGGCVSDPGFRCDDNAGCGAPAVDGVCEPTKYCAFSDVTCTSGRRYGAEASSSLRNTCVAPDDGGTPDAPFASADAPFGQPDAPFETPDAPFGTPDAAKARPDARPMPDAPLPADAARYYDAPLGGITVAISPMSRSILPLTGATFTANVTGTANMTVTWTALDGGSVSSAGQFLAPGVDGVYHLRATSNQDSTRYATATITVTRAITPALIAHAGSVVAPTGWGSQQHLFRTPAGEWWYIYESTGGGSQISTKSSTDFSTWTTGAAAAMPNTHSSDGRDLTGSFQVLGGSYVIHADAAASDFDRWHFKGVMTPGTMTWGGYKRITGAGNAVDGPTILVKPDGEVMEITGDEPTPQTPPLDPCGSGDDDLFTADVPDTGTTDFSSATGTVTWTQRVLWCVGYLVHSRQLLVDSASNVYFLFDDADEDPPRNVLIMYRTPDKTWYPLEPAAGPKVRPQSMFGSDLNYDLGGWAGTLFQGKVHVIRRLTDMTTYHHRMFDISGPTITDGGLIDSAPNSAVTGIFFGHYGYGLILVASDVNNNILYAWYDGSAWTPWVTMSVPAATGARSYVAGYDSPAGDQSAVTWTEVNTSGNNDVMGALLPH
jgi:hypothetical protein